MKRLFKNAAILLYKGNEWTVLENGFLGVDGDTINYLGDTPPTEIFDEERDMAGHLLMPGLYNLHTHTSMVLLRGLGSDLPLDRWLQEAMFPVEAKMRPEDISVGSRLAMMEMLACGTVSFTDMYDYPKVTAAEVAAAGMKANLNRPVLAFDPDEPYQKNSRVAESLAFFEEYKQHAGGRVLAEFSLHAEYTSHAHVVQAYAADAAARGARMHLHLSETRKEHEECKQRNGGKTPTRYFYDLGVLDNPTIAAHCVWVEDEDIGLLAEKGVTAVHNPSSNMKLGSGFMPVTKLKEAGVRLALGTDGAASNNNLNLFEEMHLAAVLHNGHMLDPVIMPPGDVLSMATVNGAAAQGRQNCGHLAVGNKADVVAVDLSVPHLMPRTNTPALLTYSAQGSDVAMTMVDGQILYEKGEFKTIDAEKVAYDLKSTMAYLLG